jgi:hypothetical protein
VELRIDAAEFPRSVGAEALLDLDAAHGQRCARRAHRAEALSFCLRLVEHLEVDLDAEDLLHAADVRVAEFFEGVEERTGALDAGGRIHDLVAMHLAAAALQLVLWP